MPSRHDVNARSVGWFRCNRALRRVEWPAGLRLLACTAGATRKDERAAPFGALVFSELRRLLLPQMVTRVAAVAVAGIPAIADNRSRRT